jgi:hypothetical protein
MVTAPFLGGTDLGQWRPTPGVTQGSFTWMGQTAPFVLDSPTQFRIKHPPALTSETYRRDYEEVRKYGSAASTDRTAAQTDLARFYTGNFFHIWFDALRGIAGAQLADPGDQARLLALASLATADAMITIFETKYHFNFWRPLTAIQQGDADGNPLTVGDPAWTPFIANPPYPDYTSAANSISSAIAETLELYFGTNRMRFSIASRSPTSTPTRGCTRHSRLARDRSAQTTAARETTGAQPSRTTFVLAALFR